MFLKRLSILSALAIATTTLVSIPANSASIAGTTCPKVNATKTVANIKYTCVKSGKKLLWNKGVVIKQNVPSTANSNPTAKPTPSPTAASAAENTSANIHTAINYRYSNGTLERMGTWTGKYYDYDSRVSSAFDPIRVKAYEAIRSRINNAAHPNLQFDWDVKSSFPEVLAEYSKSIVEMAASYWGWAIKEPIRVPSQLVTEQDLEWEKSQQLRFSDTIDILTLFTTDGFKQQKSWMGGGAHFWYRSDTDHTPISLLNFQTPSYATINNMDGKWVMVPAHEVTHIIQDYYRLGKPEPDTKAFDLRTHATFQEGSATLFGFALTMKNIGWYSDGLDEYLYGTFKYDNYWKSINNVDDVINVLTETEARTNNSTHQSSYVVGAMLYEYVIATYGFDSYMRILENLSKFSNFADNVKASLGISKDDLYRNAAPYLLAVYKRVMA